MDNKNDFHEWIKEEILMKKNGVTVALVIFACGILSFLTSKQILGITITKETNKAIAFLQISGTWEGEFSNYINRGNGIIQQGKIVVEMSVDEKGIIHQKNKFFTHKGEQSGYTGYITMKVKGNRLVYLGEIDKDENTNNKIENHVFEGFITNNHIYILEEYDEIFSNGKVEHQRNSLHYYFISEEEIIMLADVCVNNKLLVFANTKLVRKK